MQVVVRISQARPRGYRLDTFRLHARQLVAVAGELLALASLTVALAAGMMMLAGLVEPGIGV